MGSLYISMSSSSPMHSHQSLLTWLCLRSTGTVTLAIRRDTGTSRSCRPRWRTRLPCTVPAHSTPRTPGRTRVLVPAERGPQQQPSPSVSVGIWIWTETKTCRPGLSWRAAADVDDRTGPIGASFFIIYNIIITIIVYVFVTVSQISTSSAAAAAVTVISFRHCLSRPLTVSVALALVSELDRHGRCDGVITALDVVGRTAAALARRDDQSSHRYVIC